MDDPVQELVVSGIKKLISMRPGEREQEFAYSSFWGVQKLMEAYKPTLERTLSNPTPTPTPEQMDVVTVATMGIITLLYFRTKGDFDDMLKRAKAGLKEAWK